MKERISLTIESDLIRKIDAIVDGNKIKNRSHAFELLTMKALGSSTPRKALILVGGEGIRLRPITYEIPKPMIPFQNRTLLEHLFDLFKKYQITDITLAVGYLKDKIKKNYGDGSSFGVAISYVDEDKPLGTAGALLLAKDRLTETFIVSNGDELKDINIAEMYELHRKSKAKATIALTTVSDPSLYGVARLSGSKILEFVEKPKKEDAPSNLINSGFYIMEPEVLRYIPAGGFAMLERDVFPKLAKEGSLCGYPFSGQWYDTGNMERYETALKSWKGVSKH